MHQQPHENAALPSPGVTTPQVLLGVFICWQLWFLVSDNFFGWLDHAQTNVKLRRDEEPTFLARGVEHLAPGFLRGEGHVMDLARWACQTNKPWAQATGQLQQWSLFSGNYSRDCVFPAILVRWQDDDPAHVPWLSDTELDWQRLLAKDDGAIPPRLYLSPHEPPDLSSYFRWRQMRWRRFENGLHLALTPDEANSKEECAKAWNESIRGHLNSTGYLLTTYLKVRRKELASEWEGSPAPKQMILLLRRYHALPPEDAPPHWTGPHVVPILLWELPAPGDDGPGRYKRFDPVRGLFRSWE